MNGLQEIGTTNARCEHCAEFFHTDDLKAVFIENQPDYTVLCMACARTVEEESGTEPPCTCRHTDVDLFDPRGCEAHDRNSGYNVRQRATQAHEIVTVFNLSVMEETCPF